MQKSLVVATIALVGCHAQEGATAAQSSNRQVSVVSSRPVEDSDLIATGGSSRDKSNPFWQVSIDRDEIFLNGAAAPERQKPVHLPSVPSAIQGGTETWVTAAQGQTIRIQAIKKRCVRHDGFVFGQEVIVEVGDRTLKTCGSRGSDPQPTKE